MSERTRQAWIDYETKKDRASHALAARSAESGEVALRKRTSNLFRHVKTGARTRLDLSDFTQVIRIDPVACEAEVEGRITYEALVTETLRHGLLPPVVPQLKSITIGGAIAGGGIESSSFRHGFVHETVREMDVLLSSGEVITCSPGNEHRELFFGLPNSYGTFGYILRVRIPLVRAAPFVRLNHLPFQSAGSCFEAMKEICGRTGADQPDFVDGVVFSPSELYLTVGRFSTEAPAVSDYRFMRIFYRSIQQRQRDSLRTADYIWRWDTDWFWCARAFGMEIRPLRLLFGAFGLLRSTTYWKMRHWALKSGLVGLLEQKRPRESIIQDVEIPVDRAAEFLTFFEREIGMRPVWICPAKAPGKAGDYVLYRTDPGILYVNFGFWGSVASTRNPGHYNRLIERKVVELDGKKSLYSDSYFSENEFWNIYNRPAYDRLKSRYDPAGRLRNLFEKCVVNGSE